MNDDRDAEHERMVAMLEDAGLIEVYVNEAGKDALRLTDQGHEMARALATAGDDADPEAVLGALLKGEGEGR